MNPEDYQICQVCGEREGAIIGLLSTGMTATCYECFKREINQAADAAKAETEAAIAKRGKRTYVDDASLESIERMRTVMIERGERRASSPKS